MKITALIENKALPGLCCEHGLAVHIAYKGKNYLLDTGASDVFLENAKALQIDLTQVDAAMLSHAHYDHSGGYEGFFRQNDRAKVYLREAAKKLCYKMKDGEVYIGIPEGVLDGYRGRFVFLKEDCCLEEGVWLIGHHTPGLAQRGKQAHMYYRGKNGLLPDDFAHEQSLVFETEKGLVILNSCSHGGIDIIIREVMDVLPGRPIAAVVGGFHLMGTDGVASMRGSRKEVAALGERLLELGVGHIYTGHCTGDPAFAVLQEVLGDKMSYFCTGTTIELEEAAE